jgi:hypothetical protein
VFRQRYDNMTGIGWLMLAVFLLPLLPSQAQAAISDPTRPPMLKKKAVKAPKPVHRVIRKKAPEVYVLTSTLVSRQRTVAVINDRVVAVGDKVAGATVVHIESAQVTLRRGSREFNLMMATKKVKKVIRGQAEMEQQRLP